MTVFNLRPSRPDDGDRVVAIWCAAVDATHHFLAAEDRVALETLIRGFLPEAPLWLAVDQNDRPLAFMLIDNGHMEALFVDRFSRHGPGRRIGSAWLVRASGDDHRRQRAE
jgi:putative acetyltransferase